MRLLNTASLEVETFIGSVPPYAILSHRWEDGEVTLEDISATGDGRARKSYRKLRLSCAMAAQQNLKYIWIDTCCIDKKSSAELSEAINSMFRYYKEAEVCYAYLSDVNSTKITSSSTGSNIKSEGSDFYQSAWFTRGWTLQELIAPQILRFYNKEWKYLGTKAELKDAITSITKIPEEILLGGDLSNEPVCRKMSWVASRQTTVPEDIAYCLLGIFQVHIPLLYGEGMENAFLRLQEAILKISDDDSIFLWSASEEEAVKEPFWGLLAKSPTYFSRSPDIKTPCTVKIGASTPATLTGRGLNVAFPMVPFVLDFSESIFFAVINADGGNESYGVLLQKLTYLGQHFARVGADTLVQTDGAGVVDYSRLPVRAIRNWEAIFDVDDQLFFTSRFFRMGIRSINCYVRQKPIIPHNMVPEASGFSIGCATRLPQSMHVDRWSIEWDNREFFRPTNWVCDLDFENVHISQQPVYSDGKLWVSKLLGAVQLSTQLNGSLQLLVLILGLEHTSINTFNTPLIYHRPLYYLYDNSNAEKDLNHLLKNFHPEAPDSRNITNSERYTVTFALGLRHHKAYYFVEIRDSEDIADRNQ